ncbi:MAG: SDR family oxidoreductase [Myxococcales bacterium]|nr:SDR family oxidoreductase [Myxococcales bacterium]MDH3486172.1 SDR family oxidoreductase [Myxococcales bacterium]
MPDPQPTRPTKPSARPGGEPVEGRPSARASVALGVFGDSSPPIAKPSHTSGVRPRPATEGAVLVTGICGRLGKLLARELHRSDTVVGVDRRPFVGRPKDITHHEVDMRRKKMKDIFRGRNIRAVVHVGVLHDPRRSDRERHSWNIVAFQKLLEYMAQYEVPKLVVLSGANVYGPQSNNPQFLTEDAPLLGAQHFGGMRDLVELDMIAQSFFWKHPSTDTVILRPCHIVGRVRNAASNYLRLDRPVMIMGFDPMMQVVHEKDVVRAIQLALRPGVRGIFNIRGPGEMPLSHLVRQAGGRPRVLPSPLARLALDQLWRLRLSSFPSQELDHLRYVCMVDDARAREELGYEPTHSIDRALRDLRRVRYLV